MLASPSCLTSHDPMDCNLPGSSVPRILQARTGNHFLLQGGLHDPGIKPGSPALQADFLPSEPPGKPRLVRKREGGHPYIHNQTSERMGRKSHRSPVLSDMQRSGRTGPDMAARGRDHESSWVCGEVPASHFPNPHK